jgi:hypothetical protein
MTQARWCMSFGAMLLTLIASAAYAAQNCPGPGCPDPVTRGNAAPGAAASFMQGAENCPGPGCPDPVRRGSGATAATPSALKALDATSGDAARKKWPPKCPGVDCPDTDIGKK